MQQTETINTGIQQMAQDEISLREILEALWRGKWLISIITAVALFFGFIYSFVIANEVYRATAVIMTNPVNLSQSRSESNIIDYMAKYPTLTLDSYLHQVKSPPVMQATILALNLNNADGVAWSVSQLADRCAVTNIENTNLISISVNHTDPELATRITNEISHQFSIFITEISRRQGMQTAGIVSELLKEENMNLKQKSDDLTTYLKSNDNVELIKNEVSSLVAKITEIKNSLNSLDAKITADTDSLIVLLAAQSEEPQINLDQYEVILDLNKSASDRIRQLQLNLDDDVLPTALLQMELVEVQTRLLGNLTTRDALTNQLEELSITLREQQIRLNEEEYKYNALLREFNLAQQTFTAYQTMYKEALLTAVSDIGQTSIVIASEAIVPITPESPRRMLIISISMVLGLMLGGFVVLIKSYWENSNPVKK